MPIYMGIFEKPNVLDKKFKGDVKAKEYEGWVELQSAQVGRSRRIASATGRGSDREASAPAIQDIVVTKHNDSASTALFREALVGSGKLIVIVFVKGDETAYLKFVLQDALIASYSLGGHGADPSRPVESLSLNFTKMTYETLPQSPDTTHSQMYQLSQQRSWNYP